MYETNNSIARRKRKRLMESPYLILLCILKGGVLNLLSITNDCAFELKFWIRYMKVDGNDIAAVTSYNPR